MTSPSASNLKSTRPQGAGFYDAHNHMQDEWLAPYRDKVVNQLEDLPIKKAVVNGTTEGDWAAVSDWAGRYSWVMPSFGLHPWHVGQRSPDWLAQLRVFLQQHPAAGVGEIGLDRWILERARPDDPRLAGLARVSLEEQENVFMAQLQLAAQDNRAASIHCLEAWGRMWECLSHASLPVRGFLLHAYGGPEEMVAGFAQRGAYFSFNGSFLNERKERQQQTFRSIPMERLLVETDAPAMPLPQAWRTHKLPPGPQGTAINHPANLEAVYTGLAALRGVPLSELQGIVEANFKRLFGPP